MSLSTEALALDVRTATKKFNARPRAALAMKLASAHLAGGRVGEALNWAESAAACKDATPKVLRAVQRMRAEQKWRLNDMAFGLVKLNVTPAGGRVVIDDRVYRPVRGHYELWLKSGTHHLQIDLPDYKTVDRIITAARGEVRTVGVSMTITRPPQLRLDIDPPNAELWVDNQYVGPVSKKIVSLAEGGHIVEIKAFGHHSWTRTVRMRLGDILPLRMKLEKIVPDKRKHKLASQVDRKLTRYEKTQAGRRPAATRPGGRTGPGVKLASGGNATGPATAPERPTSGGVKDPEDDVEAEDDGDDPAENGDSGDTGSGEIDSGTTDSGAMDDGETGGGTVSGGRKQQVTKGFWITTGGLVVAAGGMAWTLLNISDAYYANSLNPGHSQFESYYAGVQTKTYASYAVIGAGGLLTGLGGFYLLKSNGATRKGKGWYFVTTGILTAAAGGYLMFDAANTVTTVVADFPAWDPRRSAALDGLYATHQAGLITAGVGGAMAGLGIFLLATGGGSSVAGLAPADGATGWRSARVLPRVLGGGAGLDLSLRF